MVSVAGDKERLASSCSALLRLHRVEFILQGFISDFPNGFPLVTLA